MIAGGQKKHADIQSSGFMKTFQRDSFIRCRLNLMSCLETRMHELYVWVAGISGWFSPAGLPGLTHYPVHVRDEEETVLMFVSCVSLVFEMDYQCICLNVRQI